MAHLCCAITDVPPQPNCPSSTVLCKYLYIYILYIVQVYITFTDYNSNSPYNTHIQCIVNQSTLNAVTFDTLISITPSLNSSSTIINQLKRTILYIETSHNYHILTLKTPSLNLHSQLPYNHYISMPSQLVSPMHK